MNERSTTRATGLIGAAALLAAIAVAVPAISAADHGGDGGHSDRTVGTIDSFDPDTGTLVIAPESGDDVTGAVSERTRIDCEHEHGDDDDHGDDGPGDDAGDDHGGPGPGKHDDRDRGNCSADDLEPGRAVEEAELEIRSSGLVYEEIELR